MGDLYEVLRYSFLALAVASAFACSDGRRMYGGGGGGGTVKGRRWMDREHGREFPRFRLLLLAELLVLPGAKLRVTVTWTNYDAVTHTVTADGGLFGGSGRLATWPRIARTALRFPLGRRRSCTLITAGSIPI